MRRLASILLAAAVTCALLSSRAAGQALAPAVAVTGLGALMTHRFPRTVGAVFAGALVVSSGALVWFQADAAGLIGLVLGLGLLARVIPDRIALPLSVVILGCFAVIIKDTNSGEQTFTLIGIVAIMGCCGMMFFARRLANANRRAERLLVELDRTRTAEARAAGLAERQRLAREMHDVLAHSLSGLILQLEGARMLAVEHPADPRLAGVIERAHHLGRAGFEEARQAIGMLRDDELPGPERLAALATQFQEDRGIPCEFTITGQPHELSSEARLAVYRVAQEALTNITKHACPERVVVRLTYEQCVTTLSIEDFDTYRDDSRRPAGEGTGYGLTGMRERAELLGGQLVTAATNSGFRVELQVPT